jgi:hypothetical protein
MGQYADKDFRAGAGLPTRYFTILFPCYLMIRFSTDLPKVLKPAPELSNAICPAAVNSDRRILPDEMPYSPHPPHIYWMLSPH